MAFKDWFLNDRSFHVKMVKDTPTGQQEVSPVEEAKNHFERNKNAYIVGAVGVVFTGFFAAKTHHYMRGCNAVAGNAASDGLDRVAIRPLSFFSKQTNNVIAVIEREGPGHLDILPIV